MMAETPILNPFDRLIVEQLAKHIEEFLSEICDARLSLACALEDNRPGIGAYETIIEEMIFTVSEAESQLYKIVRSSRELEEKLHIENGSPKDICDTRDDE